jgi:hypothetical protein
MNIKSIIQSVKNKFGPQPEIQDDVVLRFMGVLERIRCEDMSCKEMYAQLDEFVERELKSHDAARIMPLIQEHIELCPGCCEEYEALLAVLEHTKAKQ